MKLSIIYAYRNRDLERIRKSLQSLDDQTDSNFQVYFIDYGSDEARSQKIKKVCSKFDFISYNYVPTKFQPWNKSKALNYVIKTLGTEYCFVADVDVIFHPDFIKKAKKLQKEDRITYFQVGYLDSQQSKKDLEFSDYQISRLSTPEATGLSLFPVEKLKEINGFDEFYHFWGSEDTDIHVRLENAGNEARFYDEELLLLHQWHPSYQSQERTNTLTDLKISGVLPLNHQHLKTAKELGSTKVNLEGWGQCITEEESRELKATEVSFSVTNEKRQVDDILFGQLPGIKNGIIKISFKYDPFQQSAKYHLKKKLGKKVPHYYTFKEMNDRVILHLISFYRNLPYSIISNKNKGEIEIAIKFS
ncbi:glycosyltransferase family 2 protein [Christiangramia echinicola]|uniref:glycosyltransferase family 2 protein n=1 Tax=Christiangramia echinicola TaxID=279359 RepID=UPI000478ADD0|nr:glycosyltransferase family A protein [Christiangramia echinicola]